MRELDAHEVDLVSGGLALGTGPNGIFSERNIAAAMRLRAGLGLLGVSFLAGYGVGTFMNQQFGISSALSERLQRHVAESR